jgi:dTDP-4-dehydrorhamnose reductase
MARRFIITGSRGQLGQCLARRIEEDARRELVASYSHSQLDIGNHVAIASLFEGSARKPPDALVNAAAFTSVDACETQRDESFRANALAPGWLAESCYRAGVKLVHVSTDYVFDGESQEPYSERSPTGPRTAYGEGKLEGERAVLAAAPDALVVRTSWVFGPGKNFVQAILRQARLRRSGEVSGPLRVVDDQVGSPTYADDLAVGILALLDRGARGVYHLANTQRSTWWDFAREILDQSGYEGLVVDRIKTADLDLPAHRPANSVLDCSRAAALGISMRPWRQALRAYLESADGSAEGAGTS